VAVAVIRAGLSMGANGGNAECADRRQRVESAVVPVLGAP